MQQPSTEQLKYPIGKNQFPEKITEAHIKEWISILEEYPEKLRSLVENLSDEQLETRYRDGGWTVRQVIHHLADSHHHSYIRFKWALTEDKPLIKAYFEDRWAELHDSKNAPISFSLNALSTTHAKLVYLLKGLTFDDLQKDFIHPETNKEVTLAENISVYA
ncbi:MAG: putative metal-dependent hydrolase, partial [Flavobacteriaceae bacterium]|nr:putative metal-dependent hydrolase [Flavobacteriaceae bacterium]